MLLRRVIEHVKSQNWIAVGLDFIIVVLGVFIGLQVDDWNNKRIALNFEADYLEQLARETDQNLVVYEENIEFELNNEAMTHAYYRYLNGEDVERPAEATLLRMLCHPGFVSSPPYDNSVLEEMIASGMLARLQDRSLRSALANYRATQKTWDQLVIDSSDEYKKIFRFIDQFRQWRPATVDEGFGNCAIDFPALESHERALSYVANYQRFSYWHHRNLTEIAEILAEVKGLLPPSSSE